MNLLSKIDRLKPTREGSLEIASKIRGATGDPRFELGVSRGIAASPCDGERTVTLHRLEQLFAALIAKHLTNQRPEHMDVVTQGRVLGRKLEIGAAHVVILHPGNILKRKGRRGNPSGPVRFHAVNGVG
jgi:hypothetical protein